MSDPTTSPLPLSIPKIYPYAYCLHEHHFIVDTDVIKSGNLAQNIFDLLKELGLEWFILTPSCINVGYYATDAHFECIISLCYLEDKGIYYLEFAKPVNKRLGMIILFNRIRDASTERIFPAPLRTEEDPCIKLSDAEQEKLYGPPVKLIMHDELNVILEGLRCVLSLSESMLTDMITYMPVVTAIINLKPFNDVQDVLWTLLLSKFAKKNPALIKSLLSVSQIEMLVMCLADSDKNLRAKCKAKYSALALHYMAIQ